MLLEVFCYYAWIHVCTFVASTGVEGEAHHSLSLTKPHANLGCSFAGHVKALFVMCMPSQHFLIREWPTISYSVLIYEGRHMHV